MGPSGMKGVASTRTSGRPMHLSAQGSGLEKQKPLQPSSTKTHGGLTFAPNAVRYHSEEVCPSCSEFRVWLYVNSKGRMLTFL